MKTNYFCTILYYIIVRQSFPVITWCTLRTTSSHVYIVGVKPIEQRLYPLNSGLIRVFEGGIFFSSHLFRNFKRSYTKFLRRSERKKFAVKRKNHAWNATPFRERMTVIAKRPVVFVGVFFFFFVLVSTRVGIRACMLLCVRVKNTNSDEWRLHTRFVLRVQHTIGARRV